MPHLPSELKYLLLIFALFVVPPLLGRWRVPAGVTAFALGGLSAALLGWFRDEPTLPLLSKFGVMALFLLAGLEVDLPSLRRHWRPISGHVALKLATLAAAAWALQRWAELSPAVAWLTGLVLLTPSTGFILESLETSPLGENEKGWTKNIAIAVELTALLILFVAMRSGSAQEFILSTGAFAALLFFLPLVLRGYARFIAPFAPNTEFAFLIMVALLTGTLTRALGTYYLVGAFMVGLVAQRFRASLPSLSSERLLYALKLFAFFFMPFYFFHAGQAFGAIELSWVGVAVGAGLLVLIVPLRVLLAWAQLRWVLGESLDKHRDVAVALLPNLVFGVVISGILLESFQIPAPLYLGLMVYTGVVSTLPAFILKSPVGDAVRLALPAPPEGAHPLSTWIDPNASAGPRRGPRPPLNPPR
jgi:Kef-type K+ transport system membrane component KefB